MEIEIKEDELWIYDVFRDVLFAKHKISLEKGRLVQNNDHLRNTEEKVKELQNKLLEKLSAAIGSRETLELFLEGIKREKPRYASNQYKIIEKVISETDKTVLSKALEFCAANSLHSAVDFKDAAAHFKKTVVSESSTEELNKNTPPPPDSKLLRTVNVSRRDIGEYIKNLGGGNTKCLN